MSYHVRKETEVQATLSQRLLCLSLMDTIQRRDPRPRWLVSPLCCSPGPCPFALLPERPWISGEQAEWSQRRVWRRGEHTRVKPGPSRSKPWPWGGGRPLEGLLWGGGCCGPRSPRNRVLGIESGRARYLAVPEPSPLWVGGGGGGNRETLAKGCKLAAMQDE